MLNKHKHKLSKGLTVIVDYKCDTNEDVVDFFINSFNLEGSAILDTINIEDATFTIVGLPSYSFVFDHIITIKTDNGEYMSTNWYPEINVL